jgi:hypothetical protein
MVALAPLEVVLIDLDVKFCGTEARAIEADYTVEAIAAALRAFHLGDRSDTTQALCACAISLLILCMDMSKHGSSTVLVKTTSMLLDNVHIVIRLLAEDDAAVIFAAGRPSLMWMGASFSALSQIRYYASLRAAGYIPYILRKSLDAPQTKLLVTCQSARDAATYVRSRRAMADAAKKRRADIKPNAQSKGK